MSKFETTQRWVSRRSFLYNSALAGGGLLVAASSAGRALAQAPAIITADSRRIAVPYGVQAGDITAGRAIVWSRADRAARMIVEVATTESFKNAKRISGPVAVADTDYTARIDLSGLPEGQRLFYRVSFQDLSDLKSFSQPITGQFRTPAADGTARFVWSGDTAGQGYGINPDFGGMRIYEAMRKVEPHFFIHSGDTIYADGPIPETKETPQGVWRNLTTEAKSKVAETLEDFRGAHAYNLMDENLRRFNAEVPMYAQWDDHETTNNWYWEKRMDADQRYKEKSVAVMAANGTRAFMEYMPIRQDATNRDRIYSKFSHGRHLDVFRLDMRSYRAANSANTQAEQGPETTFLGAEQIRWLKQELLASDATWKVIAADMPIGLIVYDNGTAKTGSEAIAQGNGPALGRELEIADLLSFIRRNNIRNTVWLTADVHYTAAHYYDPNKAKFQDFEPFWEFVSGPLNAGTFGPNELDDTFGPQLMYVKAPPDGQTNLAPSAGMQFFGQVDIDADGVMLVTLKDLDGQSLYTKELTPVA
ncbi:alkaline phosphatase [Skermanella stibiiresistens SB22]|uniref:Alkaline phosphatase n=1 Tax=Skermanella stibiiresistens SB22 TaxID=1385369 RepID=W9H6D1_9PROT|nr:alkaline phosphatase D family protein [Skermanella stibiiresistens]EWY41785.1 alkaline phosphatase [Skermanella stibiiresistens SB22]